MRITRKDMVNSKDTIITKDLDWMIQRACENANFFLFHGDDALKKAAINFANGLVAHRYLLTHGETLASIRAAVSAKTKSHDNRLQ